MRTRAVVAVATVAAAVGLGLWVSGWSRGARSPLRVIALRVDSAPTERHYLIYVPARLPRRPPVVLFLHGAGSTAEEIATGPAGHLQNADRYGFIAVFPTAIEGTAADGASGGYWNSGSCKAPQPDPCDDLPPSPLRTKIAAVDDIEYLRAVIDDVSRHHDVNAARIHVWGHSRGGMMAQRVACELADRVASVASVAGVLTTNPCRPSRPIAVQLLQADDDVTVPVGGNALLAPVTKTVAAWRQIDQCASPEVTETPHVVVESSACAAGTAVDYLLLDHGGHNFLNEPNPPIDFFAPAWRFFQTHPLPARQH